MNCTIAQNSKSAITTFSFSASWISSPHRPHSLHTDASVNNLGSGMPPSWTFAVDLCQKNVTDFALFYVTHLNNQSMTCVDVQASLPHLVPSQHQVHLSSSTTSQNLSTARPWSHRCPCLIAYGCLVLPKGII